MKVTLRNSKIRKLTAQLFKGKRLRLLAAVFAAFIISRAPAFILGTLFSNPVVTYLLNLYVLVMTGPLTLGLVFTATGLFREEEDSFGAGMARGFGFFSKALNVFAVSLIFTLLWSFLFIIPGIIAAIRYSQAFFVLADQPQLGAFECINISKRMMEGNKAKYFFLQLSYLPLFILLSIPSLVAAYFSLDISGAIFDEQYIKALDAAYSGPLVALLNVLVVIAAARLVAANTCFYDIASGNLRLEFSGQIPDIKGKDSIDRYEISGFETNTHDAYGGPDET